MPKLKDISGQKFERLTAIEYVGNGKWLCKCDCGNTSVTYGAQLRNGSIRSCGCLRNDIMKKIGEENRTKKICPICGNEFYAPPTGRTTCSKECETKKRKQSHIGSMQSDSVRKKMSESAKGRDMTELQKQGTTAAMQSPKSGRFRTNSSAKRWELISPFGEHFKCQNLRNFVRENPDLFGHNGSDEAVRRICSGFMTIKRNIRDGKSGQSYKGWTLQSWDDRKVCEIEKQNKSGKP